MRCVHGDQPAQDAAGDHIANKMVIRRHQADEHWSTNEGAYDSTPRRRNQPHRGEAQDPGGVARGKAAKIVATLKRMEPVGSVADERWVVMGPSLGPVAAANITQANTEFIGHNQT